MTERDQVNPCVSISLGLPMIGEMAVRFGVYILVVWVVAKMIVGEGSTFGRALLAAVALTATSWVFFGIAQEVDPRISYLIYVVHLLILQAIFELSLGNALVMMVFTWVGGMLVRLGFQ